MSKRQRAAPRRVTELCNKLSLIDMRFAFHRNSGSTYIFHRPPHEQTAALNPAPYVHLTLNLSSPIIQVHISVINTNRSLDCEVSGRAELLPLLVEYGVPEAVALAREYKINNLLSEVHD